MGHDDVAVAVLALVLAAPALGDRFLVEGVEDALLAEQLVRQGRSLIIALLQGN